MNVNIVHEGKNPLPAYQTEGSSGVDLYANLDAPSTITFGKPVAIPTGLFLEIPKGYEAQVRSRSGLAVKHGIFCLNAPGTIDSDYRGEVKVILANVSDTPYTVEQGDRIAQLVFQKVEHVTFTEVDALTDTTRGAGGFGHTGIKQGDTKG